MSEMSDDPPWTKTTERPLRDSGLAISSWLPGEDPEDQTIPLPNFEILKLIGAGAFGVVYLVRNWVSGALFAAKVILTIEHSTRESDAVRIYQALSLQPHLGLMPIYDAGFINDDPRQGVWYVTVIADDQVYGRQINPKAYSPRTLASELIMRGRFSAKNCKKIIKALLKQVYALHYHVLVHADIKPSNVIYWNGKPLLIDISLLNHASPKLSRNGTTGFAPPEGHGRPTGDIYSLGKLLFQMATGKEPTRYDLNISGADERVQKAGAIIQKACADDPVLRYENVGEMIADLNTL